MRPFYHWTCTKFNQMAMMQIQQELDDLTLDTYAIIWFVHSVWPPVLSYTIWKQSIFHFVVLLASVRISWQSLYNLSSLSFSNPDVQSLLLYNFLALLISKSPSYLLKWWCQSLRCNRQWTFTQREGVTTVQLCAICGTHSLTVWPSTFTLSQTQKALCGQVFLHFTGTKRLL